MQLAKIHLSSQQMKLVSNPEWILTKNAILQHIQSAFGDLFAEQQQCISTVVLPEAIRKTGGKISKGENYLGLPWIVLDHPRFFTRTDIFAIRTMFWWGKCFSTTLHLSGQWQQHFSEKLLAAFEILQKHDFRIAYQGHEWVHDVNDSSYLSLQQIKQEESGRILKQASFVKIAACTAITNANTATRILMNQFDILVSAIK